MTLLYTLVAVALVAYAAAATAAGFRPAAPRAVFRADPTLFARRTFTDPLDRVRQAYAAGVRATPGMLLVEEGPDELYVDARPSSRVLSGNFGMLMVLGFTEADGGTQVTCAATRKVPWAVSAHSTAAFHEAERALRMRAKRAGELEERILV